jgi:Rho-binding antiterminator
MEDKYQQVSCSLYDGVESLAVNRKKIKISYVNTANRIETTEGIIADLFSKDKAEFIRLDNGLEIRLDKITEIDGRQYSNKC